MFAWFTRFGQRGRRTSVVGQENEPPFEGLPWVGTLSNGHKVYTKMQVDPGRTTSECIVFTDGSYIGAKNMSVKGKVIVVTKDGGTILLESTSSKNSKFTIR